MATTLPDDKLDEHLDEIEHIIETLDSADLLGEPTIHPVTKKFVTDTEYDRLYGKNGSERTILKKHRPDSRIFKGVTNAKVDFSKAAKCVHNPPMTSIDKADGTQVKKYKRLGEWMLDCLDRMKFQAKFHRLGAVKPRDMFKTDGKDDPKFLVDIKSVEAFLTELAQLIDSKSQPVFVQSLKHDGCAIALYYKKSKLHGAGNRPRDGVNAASVLDHVKQVVGIPNSLLVADLDVTIRGEVELSISNFEKVNTEAKAAGEKTYENPRNATAGAMNPLGDPTVARKRKLQFVGYSVLGYDDAPYNTAMERAKWVNKTLKIPFIRVEAFKFPDLAKIENEVRSELDYGIDGIIIEVNDLAEAEAMGHQGDKPTGDPRAKLAWKFAAEKAKATVTRVRHEMKRTGKLSCVAEFPGVRLAGTTVCNCTVHNVRQMIDGGVGAGAIILVHKAGDIIPYWDETLTPGKVEVPTHCPSCNSKLEWSASNVDLLCKNDMCPARHVDSLVHYLKTFGVKGLAESTIKTLISAGIVRTFADFYRLTPDILMKKAGFSPREAILDFARIHMLESPDKEKDDARLLVKADKAAQSKKSLPLAKLIAALGIPGSGKGTGSALATQFETLDRIRVATVSDFEKSQDIGTKTAEVLHEWFAKNGSVLDDLLKYIEIEKPRTGIFSGKTFCFSGSFNPDKEYWIAAVENEGAKVTTAPSKKTTHFVWGPGSGNKKEAAEQLQRDGHSIEIMEIEDLEKLLGLDKDDDRAF